MMRFSSAIWRSWFVKFHGMNGRNRGAICGSSSALYCTRSPNRGAIYENGGVILPRSEYYISLQSSFFWVAWRERISRNLNERTLWLSVFGLGSWVRKHYTKKLGCEISLEKGSKSFLYYFLLRFIVSVSDLENR